MSEPRQLSPDGKWWWDGQKWQPVEEAPPQPPQPEPESQPPTKRSVRWQLLAGFGGLALLVVLGVCVAAVAGGGGNQQQGTPTPQAAATAAATATATTVPTTKPTATPTRTPVTPTPKPEPQVMMQMQGSGIASSGEFNPPSHWLLTYSYDCTSFGYQGNFQVFLYQGSSLIAVLANELGKGGSKTTDVYQGGQHMHLDMNSECNWSVKAATT